MSDGGRDWQSGLTGSADLCHETSAPQLSAPEETQLGDHDPQLSVRGEERRVTRARVDALVFEIAQRMAAGEWKPADAEQYALREGVSVSQAQAWAVRAGKFLRVADPSEAQMLRARNVDRLDETYQAAADDGDNKACVSAVEAQNKLLGLIVEKHEVRGSFEADWPSLRERLMCALEPYPDALAAVVKALEGNR